MACWCRGRAGRGTVRGVRRVVWLGLFALGCVNDYVVRDEDGAGSGATTDASGTGSGSGTEGASADASSAGMIPDPDTGPGDATDTGDGGDPSTGGAGDTSAEPFTCEPCTADDECGDDFDHCVDLGAAGPRCVFACPEAGCPPELDCATTTSVDGVMSVQCVPVAPMC